MKYREAHPYRVTGVDAEAMKKEKPLKEDQQPWAVYTHYKACGTGAGSQVDHQWLMVPLLVKNAAQPLAGAHHEANDIFHCEVNGETRHHFTNIHRMLHLAQKHPMVREAAPFKIEKVEGSKGHPHPVSSAGVNPPNPSLWRASDQVSRVSGSWVGVRLQCRFFLELSRSGVWLGTGNGGDGLSYPDRRSTRCIRTARVAPSASTRANGTSRSS